MKRRVATILFFLALCLNQCAKKEPEWLTFNSSARIENRKINLVDVAVQAITAIDGKVCFGLAEGLLMFDGQVLTGYNEQDGIPGSIIWGLYSEGDSLLWICAEDGPAILKDGKIMTPEKADSAFRDIASVVAVNADIYFGTANGLFKGNRRMLGNTFMIDSIMKIPLRGANPDFSNNARMLRYNEKRKTLIVGTYEGLFFLKGDKIIHHANEANGLPNNMIYDILLNKSKVWVATPMGVAMLDEDGKVLKTLNNENGLSESVTTCIAMSKESVWIGTIDGANKFEPSTDSISIFKIEDGLANNAIRSICVENDNIWFGCLIGGISRYRRR